jgi:DNA mismatch repair ATPase MutL
MLLFELSHDVSVTHCPLVGNDLMPTMQSLLVPEVIELSPQDAAEAADSLEELSVYGFEVEPFGKDSFRINGVISTLAERGDVAGGFREAVFAMRGTAVGMNREERILATIACHSAVKLGDKLSHEEMKALIKEWLSSRYPATCLPADKLVSPFRFSAIHDASLAVDPHILWVSVPVTGHYAYVWVVAQSFDCA